MTIYVQEILNAVYLTTTICSYLYTSVQYLDENCHFATFCKQAKTLNVHVNVASEKTHLLCKWKSHWFGFT